MIPLKWPPIDNGAAGYAFMDEELARHHQSPLIPLETPIPSKSYTGAKLQIYQHGEDAFFVIKLGRYPLILSIQWLQHHDITF